LAFVGLLHDAVETYLGDMQLLIVPMVEEPECWPKSALEVMGTRHIEGCGSMQVLVEFKNLG